MDIRSVVIMAGVIVAVLLLVGQLTPNVVSLAANVAALLVAVFATHHVSTTSPEFAPPAEEKHARADELDDVDA